VIERYIDGTLALVKPFLTRYESEEKNADRLYGEAKDREKEANRQERILATEERRAAAEAKRREELTEIGGRPGHDTQDIRRACVSRR
jgi:hypothetical protein